MSDQLDASQECADLADLCVIPKLEPDETFVFPVGWWLSEEANGCEGRQLGFGESGRRDIDRPPVGERAAPGELAGDHPGEDTSDSLDVADRNGERGVRCRDAASSRLASRAGVLDFTGCRELPRICHVRVLAFRGSIRKTARLGAVSDSLLVWLELRGSGQTPRDERKSTVPVGKSGSC